MVLFRNRLARVRCGGCAIVFVLCAAVPHLIDAQEGGFVAEFCPSVPGYENICTDSSLEVLFESGTSTHAEPLETGDEIPIRIVMDARTAGIQGFSYAAKHDADVLSLERVTPDGTILDPENPERVVTDEHFNATRAVSGGFISAVVLSLRENREMPLGRNVICRAWYRVASRPECSVIRIVHNQLRVPGSPPVAVNITAGGRSLQPATLRHGRLGEGPCQEVCDDLADNDGDGLVDCRDPECPFLSCTGDEVCDDGVDNNLNGLVDCEDRRCLGRDPGCPGPENCSDGIDNDFDGDPDCEDAECDGSVDCPPPRELCGDGIDNDGDSDVDCKDSDCRGWNRPRLPEVCDDGKDNDCDSWVDCHDSDCTGKPACPIETSCDDGLDDDGDGLTDCDDNDCAWKVPCAEDCDDGIDNEGDGFVDGLDAECTIGPWVIPGAAPLPVPFLRGDANGDGRITVIDALALIRFVTGEEPVRDCWGALNTNADAGLDASDALPLLRWIFLDGPPLPQPFPVCGLVYFEECREPTVCPGP